MTNFHLWTCAIGVCLLASLTVSETTPVEQQNSAPDNFTVFAKLGYVPSSVQGSIQLTIWCGTTAFQIEFPSTGFEFKPFAKLERNVELKNCRLEQLKYLIATLIPISDDFKIGKRPSLLLDSFEIFHNSQPELKREFVGNGNGNGFEASDSDDHLIAGQSQVYRYLPPDRLYKYELTLEYEPQMYASGTLQLQFWCQLAAGAPLLMKSSQAFWLQPPLQTDDDTNDGHKKVHVIHVPGCMPAQIKRISLLWMFDPLYDLDAPLPSLMAKDLHLYSVKENGVEPLTRNIPFKTEKGLFLLPGVSYIYKV